MWRCVDNRFYLRARETLLLLGECGLDFFLGEHEGNEDSFAALMLFVGLRIVGSQIGRVRIGGEASQSVATVDQLFNCEEQVSILRHCGAASAEVLIELVYPAASTVSLNPTAFVTAASVERRGFPVFESAR